jgi:hypothetical protein
MTDVSRYEQWKAVNPSDSFSWFDYAHCVLRDGQIAGDFAIAIARLVWPAFVEVQGLVFLADQYSDEKMSDLLGQGIVGQQLEYWMNLFSVDGFFSGVESSTQEDEEQLARILAGAWKAKLGAEFPARDFVVEIVRDDDVGDLCLVFVQGNALAGGPR